MRVQILPLLTLIILFASCSKDKSAEPGTDPDNGNPPPAADNMAYISSVASVNDSMAFKYNSDKTLQRYLHLQLKASNNTIYGGDALFPRYENGRVSTFYSTDEWETNNTGELYASLVYNSAQQLARVNYTSEVGNPDYDSLVYNSKGQVTEIYNRSASSAYDDIKTTIAYDNNNPVTLTDIYLSGAGQETGRVVTTYKYDDKKNAYEGVRILSGIYEDTYFYQADNNPVEITITAYTGNTVNYTNHYAFTYMYNDKGYPVSYTRVQTGDVGSGTEQFRINYLQ